MSKGLDFERWDVLGGGDENVSYPLNYCDFSIHAWSPKKTSATYEINLKLFQNIINYGAVR